MMIALDAVNDFFDVLRRSRLVSDEQLAKVFQHDRPSDVQAAVGELVKADLLTNYQVKQLLAGRYRGFFLRRNKILRPIGKGGMGIVFLAEQIDLHRKVAVKVLLKASVKDNLDLNRFLREARAVAALDHQNIVKLFDISRAPGLYYFVMEYVHGVNLQTLLATKGAIPYFQAAHYVIQVAEGLQHAHEKGFLHRDIKPGNLMLNQDGIIKILDMGLARRVSEPPGGPAGELSTKDMLVGSIDFISPEQALNESLDARSDIYSLGVTLFTLIAGRPPFVGTTPQKLMQHQFKEPPSLSEMISGEIPAELTRIALKMMAKKPGDRFQSAAEVADALRPWTERRPSETSCVFSELKLPINDRRAKSPRLNYFAGALAAFVLVVCGLFFRTNLAADSRSNLPLTPNQAIPTNSANKVEAGKN